MLMLMPTEPVKKPRKVGWYLHEEILAAYEQMVEQEWPGTKSLVINTSALLAFMRTPRDQQEEMIRQVGAAGASLPGHPSLEDLAHPVGEQDPFDADVTVSGGSDESAGAKPPKPHAQPHEVARKPARRGRSR